MSRLTGAVVWHRLTLTGFGPYRGTVALELAPGLNHLVAANEAGKSTLVNGLTAVLFGLPGTADVAAWGQGRFRNWSDPQRFAGEVEFTADGSRYRIQRNFADHQVRLFRAGADGWQQELGGAHNPGATRRLVAYEQQLRALLGIDSRELFLATFCVGQPLPAARQLDQRVQELLAGGGGHVQGALGWLAERLKALTRFTGDLGVTPQNRRIDGDLERLVAEREQRASAEAAGQAAADSLLVLQEELSEAGVAAKQAASELQTSEGTLAAWGAWRNALERRNAALRDQVQLQRSRRTAEALETEIEQGYRGLHREFPEFRDAPPETAPALEAAVALAARWQDMERRLTVATADLEQEKATQETRRQRLVAEFGPLAGRPNLIRDRQELDRRRQEHAGLTAEVKALTDAVAAHQATLAGLPDWGQLGPTPTAAVRMLRQRAPATLEGWQRFQKAQQRWQDLTAALSMLPGWLQELSAGEQDRLVRYEAERERLEREWEAAQRELAGAEERERTWSSEADAVAVDFADVAGLETASFDLLDRRAAQAARRDQLHQQAQKEQATVRWAVLLRQLTAAVVVAVVLGTAGWVAGEALGLAWPWPALATVLGALVGATVAWRQARRRVGLSHLGKGVPTAIERQLAQADAELNWLNAALGPLAAAAPAEVGRLAERVRQRDQRLRRVADLERQAPTPEQLVDLRHRAAELDQIRQSFHQETAAAWELFGPNVGGGYRDWQERRQERERLWQTQQEYSRAEFGCDPAAVAGRSVADLPETWQQWATLLALAAVAHAAPSAGTRMTGAAGMAADGAAWPVADLMDRLAGLDGAGWERLLRQAETWEQESEALRRLAARQEALCRTDEAGATPLGLLAATVAELAAAVTPFADTPLPQLQSDWTACAGLEREIAAGAARIEAALAALESLRAEVAQAAAQLAVTRSGLAAPLAAAGGSEGVARQRWQQREQQWAALRESEKGLQMLLAGHGAAAVAALQERELGLGHAALAAEAELQRLVIAHPGLPSLESAADPHELTERHQALSRRAEDLRQRRMEREDRLVHLRGRIADLQGQRPVNIAQSEVARQELDAEIQRLELERDALALAYGSLQDAATDYQRTYRERLATSAGTRFATLTGAAGRQVAIDEAFAIAVREPDGRPVAVAQLSQGAQDQLWLALRLAIADLMSGDVALPFLFDDPFLNCDEERLQRVQQDLTLLAAERQILVLSCRPEFRGWGTPAQFHPDR